MAYGVWDQRVPAAGDILWTTRTDYIGNKVYINGQLNKIITDFGSIVKVGSNYSEYYAVRDRQNSVRLVLNSTGRTTYQVNNYYPSGTQIAEYPRRSDQGIQPYKYNGKELDRSNGLDFYDYHARAYDPVLMRFNIPDPHAEKYYNTSPYAYCANNPVNFVDPDGNQAVAVAKGVRYTAQPHKLKKMYQAIKAIIFGTSVGVGGTTIFNYYVDGDRSEEVFDALTAPVNTDVNITLDARASESNSVENNSSEGSASTTSPNTPNNDNDNEKKRNTSSGNKNSSHANQKAKESAGEKYKETKSQYDNLNSKTNKTPEDKKQLKKLENQIDHWKRKQDFSGENHSRNAKGNR